MIMVLGQHKIKAVAKAEAKAERDRRAAERRADRDAERLERQVHAAEAHATPRRERRRSENLDPDM
jgi:translation initiation factor IF-3